MPDYITRDEFNAAIAALTVRGDDQTIAVDSGPGGQQVRSIQVIGDETPDDTYVSVSYDSVAEEFTVTVTNLPVMLMRTNAGTTTNRYTNPALVSATFKYDKPATGGEQLGLYAVAWDIDQFAPEIKWTTIDILTADLTGADTTTDDAEVHWSYMSDGNLGNHFFEATLSSDGTFSVTRFPKNDQNIFAGCLRKDARLNIDTAGRLIRYDDFYDNINSTAVTYAYTEPFDKQMILGWSEGGTSFALDINDNSGDYDKTYAVGRVKVSSANKIMFQGDQYAQAINTGFGFTGTGAYTTLVIKNGIIVNAT